MPEEETTPPVPAENTEGAGGPDPENQNLDVPAPEPEKAPEVKGEGTRPATHKELKAMAKARGLSAAGSKEAILARLAGDTSTPPPAAKKEKGGLSKDGSTFTVTDEPDYNAVAIKLGYPNFREISSINGVINSRFELKPGQVIQLPQRRPTRDVPDILNARQVRDKKKR